MKQCTTYYWSPSLYLLSISGGRGKADERKSRWNAERKSTKNGSAKNIMYMVNHKFSYQPMVQLLK